MSDFDDATRVILQQSLPEQEHQHIQSYTDNVFFWANTNLSLIRKWLVHTEMMLERPMEEGNLTYFYIRLSGVISDIPERLTDQVKRLKEVFGVSDNLDLRTRIDQIKEVGIRNYIQHLIHAQELAAQISLKFSTEERRRIKVFRHMECHPLLTKLSINLHEDGFENVNRGKAFQRIISEECELETYENLFPKFKDCLPVIKELQQTVRSMQFS